MAASLINKCSHPVKDAKADHLLINIFKRIHPPTLTLQRKKQCIYSEQIGPIAHSPWLPIIESQYMPSWSTPIHTTEFIHPIRPSLESCVHRINYGEASIERGKCCRLKSFNPCDSALETLRTVDLLASSKEHLKNPIHYDLPRSIPRANKIKAQ